MICTLNILLLPFLVTQELTKGNLLYPPLIAEITAEHPIFLFSHTVDPYKPEKTIECWRGLGETLKPYSALWLNVDQFVSKEPETIHQILNPLFSEELFPFVLKIPLDEDGVPLAPDNVLPALFDKYPNLFGISIKKQIGELYLAPKFEHCNKLPIVDWISKVVPIVAQYGRFLLIYANANDWARFLSHPLTDSLLNIFSNHSEYIIPSYQYDGDISVVGIGEMMGLWVCEYTHRWGVVLTTDWYHKNYMINPCLYGMPPEGASSIFSPFYRAMILMGVIGGATLYAFPEENSLWFGGEKNHWENYIRPTLESIINLKLIPIKMVVQQRINSAFQLYPSSSPIEFYENQKHIDILRSEGKMLQNIYGIHSLKPLPILIPENGKGYIFPILPTNFDNSQRLNLFKEIVGYKPSFPEWTWSNVVQLINQNVGEGNAFITTIGKWIFVFNSNEVGNEPQNYTINSVPLPVKEFTATRNGNEILLKWQSRQGDIAYNIYQRIPPSTEFFPIVRDIDVPEWKYTITDPTQTVAFSVTAITNEKEPLSGVVQVGEYKIYSAVESRIVSEVVVSPEANYAESVSILSWYDISSSIINCPDPNINLDPFQQEQANRILQSMNTFESCIISKNLEGMMNLFDISYSDSKGIGRDYLRAVFECLFHLCPAPRILWQPRRWTFQITQDGNALVQLTLFLRIIGYIPSDPSLVKSDVPFEFISPHGGEIVFSWLLREDQWKIVNIDPPIFQMSVFSNKFLPSD